MSAEKKIERLEERVDRIDKRLRDLEVSLDRLLSEMEERKRYFSTDIGEEQG